MPAGEIEVNTTKLGRGSDRCRDAAGSARRGAEELGDVPTSGIFGGHAEAQLFRGVLDRVHRGHQDELHGHHTTLTGLSGKADTAKRMFTDADESGASALGSAAAAFDE